MSPFSPFILDAGWETHQNISQIKKCLETLLSPVTKTNLPQTDDVYRLQCESFSSQTKRSLRIYNYDSSLIVRTLCMQTS